MDYSVDHVIIHSEDRSIFTIDHNIIVHLSIIDMVVHLLIISIPVNADPMHADKNLTLVMENQNLLVTQNRNNRLFVIKMPKRPLQRMIVNVIQDLLMVK